LNAPLLIQPRAHKVILLIGVSRPVELWHFHISRFSESTQVHHRLVAAAAAAAAAEHENDT
jgi:hypothetical protein